MANPKLEALVKIVYAAGTEDLPPGTASSATNAEVERDPDSHYSKPREEIQVYPWVDSKGRVHFSDRKPEDQKNF